MDIKTKNSIYASLLALSVMVALYSLAIGIYTWNIAAIPFIVGSGLLARYFNRKLDEGINQWMEELFKKHLK